MMDTMDLPSPERDGAAGQEPIGGEPDPVAACRERARSLSLSDIRSALILDLEGEGPKGGERLPQAPVLLGVLGPRGSALSEYSASLLDPELDALTNDDLYLEGRARALDLVEALRLVLRVADREDRVVGWFSKHETEQFALIARDHAELQPLLQRGADLKAVMDEAVKKRSKRGGLVDYAGRWQKTRLAEQRALTVSPAESIRKIKVACRGRTHHIGIDPSRRDLARRLLA